MTWARPSITTWTAAELGVAKWSPDGRAARPPRLRASASAAWRSPRTSMSFDWKGAEAASSRPYGLALSARHSTLGQ